MARRKAPIIPDELLDQLLAGRDAQTAFTKDGLLDELKRALAERALNAEMDHHLDGEAADGRPNSRNGYGQKTLLTDSGKLPISVPRDRLSSFDPQLIAKYRRRLPGFDDKLVSMYARGTTVREIQGHLADLYGLEVSPALISAVTDAILDEIAEWQNRPLEPQYPLVFFDALRVKIRDEGTVRNKAVYVALGVRADGRKEILGLWIEQTEGAKFWLRVMSELKTRGVEDVLIAVVDGLKGFPDAITAVFPQAPWRSPDRRSFGHRIIRLLADDGPNLHRPPDPKFARLRVVQGPQGRRRGAERDLQGQGRCRRRCCPGRFCRGPPTPPSGGVSFGTGSIAMAIDGEPSTRRSPSPGGGAGRP